MTLSSLKQEIWLHPKVNRNVVVLQTYADKAQVRLPITQVHEAEKLLKLLNKPNKKPSPKLEEWIIDRYNRAHRLYTEFKTPSIIPAGHYCKPVIPDTYTSGGLNRFIEQYLIWTGNRATRVNVEGRKIKKNGKEIRIKSTTRKGTADVTSTIKVKNNGTSVQWETKIGRDKASKEQLREQKIEEGAGGKYFFVKTAAEFFEKLDSLFNLA